MGQFGTGEIPRINPRLISSELVLTRVDCNYNFSPYLQAVEIWGKKAHLFSGSGVPSRGRGKLMHLTSLYLREFYVLLTYFTFTTKQFHLCTSSSDRLSQHLQEAAPWWPQSLERFPHHPARQTV